MTISIKIPMEKKNNQSLFQYNVGKWITKAIDRLKITLISSGVTLQKV